MSFNDGMKSSKTPEWSTPRNLFDRLNVRFGFTLDPACTHENALCKKHYTEAEDGLSQPWAGETVFLNPPYGREIGRWMRKAYYAALAGATVVCLVPVRTDTKWWWDWVMPVWPDGVELIRGRLKFGGAKTSAPFPSAIIIYRGGGKRPPPESS